MEGQKWVLDSMTVRGALAALVAILGLFGLVVTDLEYWRRVKRWPYCNGKRD